MNRWSFDVLWVLEEVEGPVVVWCGVDEGNLATKSPHGLRMRRAERAEAGCDHLQEGLARALARVHGWAKGHVKWL